MTRDCIDTPKTLTSDGAFTHDKASRKKAVYLIENTPSPEAVLDLLKNVNQKVATVSLARLIDQITLMTEQALNAAASSILLGNEKDPLLHFEVALGPVEKKLYHAELNAHSGIAGWVARHGEPCIVNDVHADSRFNASMDEMTGFVTKSIICAPLILHGKVIGVIEVLNKLDGSGFDSRDLEALQSVAATAAMSIENARLNQVTMATYKSTIKALAAAIEAKDSYTCGHSQRVMEYAVQAGQRLRFSDDELSVLEYAGILHDIGKIGVADNILTKPGRLTDEEWEVMRRHSEIGTNIIDGIGFLEESKTLIYHHHERYDGKGYPSGLKGEDIPMGARLLAVADAFDTMTTDRSYRASLGVDYALQELQTCSGTQFCPVAVRAFLDAYDTKSDYS